MTSTVSIGDLIMSVFWVISLIAFCVYGKKSTNPSLRGLSTLAFVLLVFATIKTLTKIFALVA